MNDIRDQASRRVDLPEPGLYRSRLVRGGPWVPVKITQEESGWTVAVGVGRTETALDPWAIPWMRDRYHFALRVDQAEFDYLMAQARWAQRHNPDHPAASPDQPIRLGAIKPLF